VGGARLDRAKYATKSVTDTGATDHVHHRRLRATARHLVLRAEAAQQDVYSPLPRPHEHASTTSGEQHKGGVVRNR
jgi:hypothetical protein